MSAIGMYALIAVTAAAAGAIQTVCGFGAGVLLMLVLTRYIDMLAAPTVNLIVCAFLTMALSWKYRRKIQLRVILIPLIPYLIAGAIVNAVVGKMNLHLLGVLFGVFQVALCAYYFLIAKRLQSRASVATGVICGFFSGVTASLFGVGGPLLAVFLLAASADKESYTGNMQFVFLITNSVIFFNKMANGLFPASLLPITAAATVGILIGQVIGVRLTDRLDGERMKTVVYGFIGISGVVTILQQLAK